jgi:peptide chain release factor 3
MDPAQRQLAREVERRRTFAIISHPDAGKTTLTEKLLLYGGAIREAGAVRAQKANRHATSDWLELEKQRGISVSSSVMHFEHEGHRVNILDTPGHKDFSEDTYRTLMAADSAVMVIDAAKGVETQTTKLFEVCRMSGIPIFTFVNKMDRLGRDPLELMAEIEEVLGIAAVPLHWPVGQGNAFRGIYDRQAERLLIFEAGKHGTTVIGQKEIPGKIDDPAIVEAMGEVASEVQESLELLDGAADPFDLEHVRAGEQTPMFFGSALTNFGVLPFLEAYLEIAPCPGARASDSGPIEPTQSAFSGFVFKIQANMDPDHRDRVAFVRVCSGRFEKEESTVHVRTGKRVRLAKSSLVQAHGRESVDQAFPGDVVGLFDPGLFRIGDTLADRGDFHYEGVPSFSPEHFVRVEVAEVLNRKSLEKGLDQLAQEGAVQLFSEPGAGTAVPILGAVGPLQFDVLQHRMSSEYKVNVRLTPIPYVAARWIQSDFDEDWFRFTETKRLEDRDGRPVILARSPWYFERLLQKHSGLVISPTASAAAPAKE